MSDISLHAARLGFIEKCAAWGVINPDRIAWTMAIAEISGDFSPMTKQALAVNPLEGTDHFRKRPLEMASVRDFFDTGIVDLPKRFTGMGAGVGLGGMLGGMLGKKLFNAPWLGAMVGAGGLGYLGERFGQPALAGLSKYFTDPSAGYDLRKAESALSTAAKNGAAGGVAK